MALKPLKIRVIHGPNLNMLGKREPGIYGDKTLDDINELLTKEATQLNVSLDCLQSNHEGVLIDAIQQSTEHDALIINPAAYTHTSIALRDALLAIQKPFIEVHLSDIKKREKFRHHSYLSDIAFNVFSGFGPNSYSLALKALVDHLNEN